MTQPPAPEQTLRDGRCHMCGYSLRGLPPTARCPECGNPYTSQSASRLQPRPHALVICLRLGWPILLLVVVNLVIRSGVPDQLSMPLFVLGLACLLALPVNSYFQVRSMLKRHMPQRQRTTGIVSVLRTLGTVMCILVFSGLLLAFVVLGSCLVMLNDI